MKEESNQRGLKKLKKGYTTGTCAQAAAKAAAVMLFTGKEVNKSDICLPKGERMSLQVEGIIVVNSEDGPKKVRCGVKKDSGDDPDVTNGMTVYCTVEKTGGSGITLDGGDGVGRITKPGLEQHIGDAAINKVPRQMIIKEVKEAAEYYEYDGGLSVLVEIPGGQQTAEKTFNPRLGIEGGLSILGTSGIVEPMSEKALIDTIEVEMKVKISDIGTYVLAAPGNYGLDFLKKEYGISCEDAVKCSNYVGETIDFAREQSASGLLFAAHIGKFVKTAGGIMNTHSMYADCRMELLSCAALESGAPSKLCTDILSCTTTEGALQIMDTYTREAVMERIIMRIHKFLNQRSQDLKTGAIVFSNIYGILGMTEYAPNLLEQFQMQRTNKESR